MALYFTGWKHGGENIADVLRHRAGDLDTPIQMCDALSRNFSPEFKSLLAALCFSHARREFVDVNESFPQECRHVLEALGAVYGYDAELNGANAFHYLLGIARNAAAVAGAPKDWLPWNYTKALAASADAKSPGAD